VSEPNPFNVRCGECEHVWTAALLPMEMAAAARLLMNVRCPNCGNGPKKIFCAPGAALKQGRR
jgi:hypothetical protein